MSFGFSFSDFIHAFNILTALRRRFVRAPAEFAALSHEVRNLSSVFRDIEDIILDVDILDEQKQRLADLATHCRIDLQGVKQALDRYQLLEPSGSRASRSRWIWKRLRWNREEIEELRDRVSTHLRNFGIFLEHQSLQEIRAIREDVTILRKKQMREENERILQWFSHLDFRNQQQDLFALRHERYGHWFLDSSEYQAFVEEKGETLYCHGVPGTGKTLISATVIDDLEARSKETDLFGVAYVYCNYQLQQDQQPEDLLRSLLKQFVAQLPEIPHLARELYSENQSRRKPTSQQVLTLLPNVLQEFARSFIVLDALDELHDATSSGTERFLAELFNLRSLVQVNILATSRPVANIAKQFETYRKLKIRAADQEIRYYIRERIDQLQRPIISDHPEVASAAIRKVTAVADGMILLARLHMDTIMRQPTLGDLKHTIEALPQGFEGLDRTYDDAMTRIRAQEKRTQRLAENLLMWATYAWRVLTTVEVQHALSIRPGQKSFDTDLMPDMAFLGSICAGLIETDRGSGTVRLVHHTTREYFIRNKVFPSAMTDIARSCLTYISFDDFESGPRLSEGEISSRLKKYPLYSYAALYWSYHARHADSKVRDLEVSFLQHRGKLLASLEVTNTLEGAKGFMLPSHGERGLDAITNVHIAAGFGLEETTRKMIEYGTDADARDGKGQTPLLWAASNGYIGSMHTLLSLPGAIVDINAQDSQHMTPLCYAAQRGHFEAVKMLTGYLGINLEVEDGRGRTPLLLAAVGGHEAVAELLISCNANIQKTDHVHRNVLHYSAILGMIHLLGVLVPRQDLEALSIGRYTPLLYAAENAHPEAIKVLLKYGANAKHRNERGNTCLHLALSPPLLVVRTFQLLIKCADVEAANNIEQTPLHRAVTAPWLDHFKALIAEGANISAQDANGRNVMHLAASGCSPFRLAEFLDIPQVQAQGLITSVDLEGKNALHHALSLGHSVANNAELLLSSGADPNHLDNAGNSPLSTYIRASISAIDLRLCQLLLDRGAGSWSNDQGETLAHVAAASPYVLNESLLDLLQQYIDDLSQLDNEGRTILHHAVLGGGLTDAVLRWVLSHTEIDLRAIDSFGRSAIDYAEDDSFTSGSQGSKEATSRRKRAGAVLTRYFAAKSN